MPILRPFRSRLSSVSSRRAAVLTAALVAATAFTMAPLAGCSKKDTAAPVATPSFSASRDKVALGSPIDFTYQFDVTAPIKDDYRVLVHVVNPDGDIIWIDDHAPEIPTSKWQPGQKIQYTRNRFVPVVPFTGEATVRIGLYKDNERLPLQGADPEQRTYKVGTLQLLPQSDNVFIIYKSGWNNAEFSADNTTEWQWSQKSGVVTFKNPKKDATLYFEYDARADLFTPPQNVTVSIGGTTVATFPAENVEKKLLRLPVTAAQMGDADMVEMHIDVDKSFSMAALGKGTDTRELGIRVYHLFIEPK